MARQPQTHIPSDDDLSVDHNDDTRANGKPPAHDDSVLESLGKAIIAPVKNTADPDNDPNTR